MKTFKQHINEEPKFHKVIHKNKTIGHVWNSEGEWHSKHSATGMSWATDNKKDAEHIVRSHHQDHLNDKR